MEYILVVLCVYLAFRAPNFLTADNLLSVLRSVSMQGLIAFGMTLVIIVGEIDLSVGAAASFAGCIIAWFTQHGTPVPLGAAITLATGYAIGAFTGLVRGRYAVPTFITTLALLTVLKGAALMVTGRVLAHPVPVVVRIPRQRVRGRHSGPGDHPSRRVRGVSRDDDAHGVRTGGLRGRRKSGSRAALRH